MTDEQLIDFIKNDIFTNALTPTFKLLLLSNSLQNAQE